ncbi:DUF58 domain-containing protein [Caenimonas sp. SL110]|uniref:DUF58 domain-containing protein n=1 Tax=Caenimonas sp. SL110 TaxID=1450524 RepID=UPI0006549CBE|nr:DUF58 domain-containing protein [Caenimonas sp. SL110]
MLIVPSRRMAQGLVVLAVAAAAALIAQVPLAVVAIACAGLLAAMSAWIAIDYARSRRAWNQAPLRAVRKLPHAFALGAPTVVTVSLFNEGSAAWQVDVFDEVDSRFAWEGLPQSVTVPPAGRIDIHYTVIAQKRGLARFGATQLRCHTPGGSLDIRRSLGTPRTVRVYPNFAAVAGYAWLAGDRRLAQIGIKTYAQRGMGTDFRQLSDYRRGDPIRHIDWKATMRHGRPIVREFQDDRDQRVFFMLDCGRRMRADEGTQALGGSHFDQALNALMLLAYVALKEGDEVGAMTFGNAAGEQREFAPRKGTATLNALMNRLHDLEPGTTHPDYNAAAQELLRLNPRRALVILLTNFRGEDAAELKPALRLLRQRHLVLVASLREKVIGQIAAQPLGTAQRNVEVAAAHLFDQSRRDAFASVVENDRLSIDVEPSLLAVTLVNRYHSVKRAGLL